MLPSRLSTFKSVVMKSRPILFSKDMVEAILQGRKTQTRRIIKDSFNGCWTGSNGSIQPGGHPCPNDPVVMHPGELIKDYEGQHHQYEAEVVEAWFHCSTMDKLAKCPYGKKGDIIYARETIWTNTKTGRILYEKPKFPPFPENWKATPSIHVPKKHARIWLQITDIRVERLMSISEGDAIAEGIKQRESGLWEDYSPKFMSFWIDPIRSYFSLWDSINGEKSHRVNPWVWVIEFESIGFEKAAMLLTHGEKV